MTGDAGRRIDADLWLTADGIARGFAFDPADPAARLAVEILADGLPIALIRAQETLGADVPRTSSPGGHPNCGFSVRVDGEVLTRTRRLVARLANSDVLVGAVAVGGLDPVRTARPEPAGHVRWAGGLRLSGHVSRGPGPDRVPSVKALIDGTEVARVPCRSWVQLDHGRVARAFELHLPDSFADGRVREVEVVTDAGVALPGSPCLAVAFPDPLSDWIDGWAEVRSETIRARFAEGLLPQSMPFRELEGWLARFPAPRAEVPTASRVAVLVVGDAGLDATVASLEAQEGIDWSAAAVPTDASRIGFDPRQVRDFLDEEGADCTLLIAAVSGTVFAPGALALLHAVAEGFPEAGAVYPDLLVAAEDGRRWPLALPAFDPELFLERAYCGLVYGIRRGVARAAIDRCTSLFDLFPADEGGPPSSAPVHLPVPLATVPASSVAGVGSALVDATRTRLAARGSAAVVTPGERATWPSVRVRRAPPPGGVSVLIAVRDAGPALARTLASLDATRGAVPMDVVIADNGSTDPATRDVLDDARSRGHAVVPVPGWFCVPHLLGWAAAAARADHLLVLEAGVAASEAGWLDEMLGRCAGRDVGAVGGLVAWETGVIRDAGLVLGPRLSVVPRFTDRVVGDDGHAGLLTAAHRCSAVSAACLMTPRRLFEDLGGFDVRAFPTLLYAADYGMRLRAAGRHVVLTPHARLRLAAAAPSVSTPDSVAEREADLFRHRWSVAPGCDPFYSPWMAMDASPYSALAWPPSPFAPRQPGPPVARPIPPGV